MAQKVEEIKKFLGTFKDDVLIPLAEAGVLSEELCSEAIEEYIAEIEASRFRDIPEDITKDGKYEKLHPFYQAPFKIGDNEWLSIEHYWRACRFFGTEDDFVDEIKAAKNAQIAHRRGVNGEKSNRALRPDWIDAKEDEIKKAYVAMFEAHPECLEVLKTSEATQLLLRPHTDICLGIDKNGEGENLAGKILLKLREKYNAK